MAWTCSSLELIRSKCSITEALVLPGQHAPLARVRNIHSASLVSQVGLVVKHDSEVLTICLRT